jgi:HEAT repeat protein
MVPFPPWFVLLKNLFYQVRREPCPFYNVRNLAYFIRSLKAINEIGIVFDMEPYKVFLNSPIWEERLMLAKLLGVFSLEEAYPYLEQLLQDENWWVRSNAARSIGNSKDGRSRLEMFIATAHDQYAIDMAREVLGEGTG